jgi:hypothetical protein
MFLQTLLNWFLPIRLHSLGGGGGGTQTQVKELPAWAQPYAENLLSTGMSAINEGVQPYGGMRVAPQNQNQQAALAMVKGRAAGSPGEIAARQQNYATQAGQYLGANPWLNQDYTQKAIEANAQSMGRGYATGTAAQLDSAAARARAFGGTGYQQQVGQNEQNLGNAIGQMANQYQLGRTGLGVQDWQQERSNMVGNNAQAIAGENLDWTNMQHLMNAGGIQNQYTQQLLDQAYADYQTQANAPYQQIDRAGNLLGMAIGNSGQATASSSGGGQNLQQLMQLAGLGLAGYGAYKL